MSNPRDTLAANYDHARNQFESAAASYQRGDLTLAQLQALEGASNEAYYALDSHDADTKFGGYQGHPGADTRMLTAKDYEEMYV